MVKYAVLGHSVLRIDGWDKVIGQAKYGSDLLLPQMLVAKVLRSRCAHARILSLDTSRAEQLPGVRAVVTSRDTPRVRFGRWVQDRTIFAWDRVRYVGEPLAAVAAVDEDTAEEALELVRVDYEELPAVFDPIEAMRPSAPTLHEELDSYLPLPPERHSEGNILHQVRLCHGDVGRAWAEADLIHEERYRTQPVYQGIIQPHEAIAAIDHSGKITLWATNKAPFDVRRQVAQSLGLPPACLRVVATAMGGDFGARGSPNIEPVCVLLCQKTRRPVRLSLTREEEFTATFYREAAIIDLKVGARKDGTLLAIHGRIVFDTGAYSDVLGHLRSAAAHLVGLYCIPSFDVAGYIVYTNNTPRGQCRAPRTPQPLFALESHIDALAQKLGMDPIELRLKNAVEDGCASPTGGTINNSGLKKTLHMVADYLRREKGSPAANQGWGIACGERAVHPIGSGSPRSAACVKINEDGTCVLFTGVTEVGCGQTTVLAQIVAEVLGIPLAHVTVVSGDTELTPHEENTGGSLTTGRVGTTVRLAAEDARDQLLRLAAERLNAKPQDMEVGGGMAYVREAPEIRLSIANLAAYALTSPGGPVLGTGSRHREARLATLAQASDMIDAPQYGTHAALVETDPETGQVKVLKYLAAHDVGFALNPVLVQGQIAGGVAFGLGYALMEETVSQRGWVLNPSLSDYHMPTAPDLPNIECAIVEVPSRFGPFGAKGIGEPPTVPVAPAIANAIYAATGVRITDLPITPEKVHQALRTKVMSRPL